MPNWHTAGKSSHIAMTTKLCNLQVTGTTKASLHNLDSTKNQNKKNSSTQRSQLTSCTQMNSRSKSKWERETYKQKNGIPIMNMALSLATNGAETTHHHLGWNPIFLNLQMKYNYLPCRRNWQQCPSMDHWLWTKSTGQSPPKMNNQFQNTWGFQSLGPLTFVHSSWIDDSQVHI